MRLLIERIRTSVALLLRDHVHFLCYYANGTKEVFSLIARSTMSESSQETSDNISVWQEIESGGIKLPEYITKLLIITGYENLQCLSKLSDVALIKELEQYATDNLSASELGLLETEEKYFYNQRTKDFQILPGHKHLIVGAADIAQKMVQDAEEASFNPFRYHFLDYSGRADRQLTASKEPAAPKTVEGEQESLAYYIKTWIDRKVLFGQMDPFIPDQDYKIHVFQQSNGVNELPRACIYAFICLRCNTTIKAYTRPNGSNWNAANVCRHMLDVHSHTPSPPNKKRKTKSSAGGSSSTSINGREASE